MPSEPQDAFSFVVSGDVIDVSVRTVIEGEFQSIIDGMGCDLPV
jgi:large-conductance mechanosensitive channel